MKKESWMEDSGEKDRGKEGSRDSKIQSKSASLKQVIQNQNSRAPLKIKIRTKNETRSHETNQNQSTKKDVMKV